MDSDPLFSLAPYEKTHSSGEIKSHKISLNGNSEELTEEMREILPNADKVELSAKIDFTESMMTYHLTQDRNLNEYILMANQAAQVKENSISLSLKEKELLSEATNLIYKSGCDFRA